MGGQGEKLPVTRYSNVGGVLLVVLMVGLDCVLVFAIGRSIRDGRLARESGTWPEVPGVVVSAQFSRSSAGRTSPSTCWPIVRYRYVVAGTGFTGRRVTFLGGYGCTEARDIVNRYPANAIVTVRYRPGDPTISVLEPGRWDGPIWLALLVPITLVVAFLTIVLGAYVRLFIRMNVGK
jgi:hypothetical protein